MSPLRTLPALLALTACPTPEGYERAAVDNARSPTHEPAPEAAPATSPTAQAPAAAQPSAATPAAPAQATPSSPATAGTRSTTVTPQGYFEWPAGTFTATDTPVTATLQVDVHVPSKLPDPHWGGEVQAYLTCTEAGVHHAYLGRHDVTPLPKDVVSPLRFALDATQLGAAKSGTPCSIDLALNAKEGGGDFRFEGWRFVD